MIRLIAASTSTIHGGAFLEYLLPELKRHFESVSELLFIPYARPGGISHAAYTEIVSKALIELDIQVKGLHEFDDPKIAILKAQAIFVGGGNTFVLLNQLIQLDIMDALKRCIEKGTPYLGTSAGSNITGINAKTTNDMPIILPTTLDGLGVLPFNINPHYLDPDPKSKHKGETRETRIKEFHVFNEIDVIGLREGSWIERIDNAISLKGTHHARIFRKDSTPVEIPPGTFLNKIL